MEEFFKPKEKTAYASLPFITRPKQDETFIVFASENDGFEVLLHQNVQETIRREALEAVPNETIGLLAGRVVRDERGPYTLVLAATGARPNEVEATPSHVRISASGHAQVRSRLESFAHGLDIIGWYHSHPRFPARFSPVDITEQSTWRDPNHVGIVISGIDRNEPLGVYRGPKSNLMVPKTNLPELIKRKEQIDTASLFAPVAVTSVVVSKPVAEPAPAGAVVVPNSTPSTPSETGKTAAFVYRALGVGLFGIVLTIVWLDNRLSKMEARLTNSKLAQAQAPTTPQPEPSPSLVGAVPLNIANPQDVSSPKPEISAKPLSVQPQLKKVKARAKQKKKTTSGDKSTPAKKKAGETGPIGVSNAKTN
jgi:proteasome lid subunit RPN8/RPN11